MMKVLIMICAITTSHAECQPETARVTIQGPDVSNHIECARNPQAYLAGTAIEVGPFEYVKVTCTRTTIGKGNHA